ncbi:TetR/AcrR family transcriptional regulator [Mucilaginibacter conchicola]|uniref:TetR/AcrR family transcriptional regulator n=1 Tax=Mucilaginibacter conchicola TaxID=2303333 RepID=A0A372NPF0_9SPHI|nr:TetR/AcrR family transcriptional regulator [Mucilaginibacter conchicola]RFZ90245.1 TetR/AcrR family transcriptional regulator [Mucilaginibacter conchicola]
MPLKDTGTEQLIKDTTKRMLFGEGKLFATTQEIADAAGINRSAVHYYYRTRDQLIMQVFQESMIALSNRLDDAMGSSASFEEKVTEIIDIYLKEMMSFPYEETFMVTELNKAGQQLVAEIKAGPVQIFLEEVEAEISAGRIEKMSPVNFLMNLFALLSYPIMMAPLYRQFFQIAKEDFDQIIQERKELVLRLVLKRP